MADTYTQIYLQFVFAVQHRKSLISPTWEEELYKYISGATQRMGHKMLAINGMPDHIHLLTGFNPTSSISDYVREIKKSSNAFIAKRGFTKFKFTWQSGYGAFSYSKKNLDAVINYINNQKEHHKSVTFKDEYIKFLKTAEVDFKEEFLFDWI